MRPAGWLDALLDFFTARRAVVAGESMAPAYHDGDRVVVSVRAYRRRRPERFDVVLLRPDAGGREDLKRVVGLPGEAVEVRDGALWVGDARPAEPHLAGPMPAAWRFEWRPAEGEYVVLGDNRAASTDSRQYGPVALAAIIGPVTRRF